MPDRKLVPDIVKEQAVLTMPERASVRSAADIMTKRNVGAVLIAERERLRGIFTERDMVKRVVAVGLDPLTTRLVDVMTPNPLTLPPDATAIQALKLMQSRNIRHLPLVADDVIVGIVSIRDLFDVVTSNLENLVAKYENIMFGIGRSR